MRDGSTLYQQVLAWVNDERVDYGDEPLDALPEGERGDPHHCVLANALGHRFSSYEIASCPDFVREWVKAFDAEEDEAVEAFEEEA